MSDASGSPPCLSVSAITIVQPACVTGGYLQTNPAYSNGRAERRAQLSPPLLPLRPMPACALPKTAKREQLRATIKRISTAFRERVCCRGGKHRIGGDHLYSLYTATSRARLPLPMSSAPRQRHQHYQHAPSQPRKARHSTQTGGGQLCIPQSHASEARRQAKERSRWTFLRSATLRTSPPSRWCADRDPCHPSTPLPIGAGDVAVVGKRIWRDG
ncbi:uncharacterized protein LY79DRAFT_97530 [Colletotrichum navitas]|uniref:Uncharacterized protein n=1 Tax=Colletotrichum navitas TaxID=681940 RepID=A0AAD8PK93_9PEZI|nr:uncharacterized protein LY79DRAFT_97530 [Colletotrichum navitas]KAK1566323.1 hypothetical protein LY79DRAFT_97530 [Colletotrichum navitas]